MSGVVVNGVDLESRYGLRLTGDSEFNPPSVKSYLLDLPGGDGSLDVTEAFGDVLYENREDVMVFFAATDPGAAAFERLKTRVMRMLHGRAYDYTLPFDPGYVYHGRFAVDETYMRMHYRRIKVRVTANPYKSAGVRIHDLDAQTGAHIALAPGRGRVSPVFESRMPVHVIAGDVDAMLPPGSHTAVGLSIGAGDAEVYVNTGGSINGGTTTWADVGETAWGGLASKRWHEAMWMGAAPPESEAYRVRIAYEVLEL